MSKSHVSRVRELYKLILRVHRSLPEELKILGDNYAREEFKRHKKCKPQEAHIFLNEWREYAVSMSRQAAPTRAERRLPANEQHARPSRRLRAADPRLAAEGAGLRAADPRQAAGGEEIGAADPEQAAGGRVVRAADLRFGNDLDLDRIRQLTPEQLLNLSNLLMAARGENPHQYEDEPVDIGSDLIETDLFSKVSEHGKQQILRIETEEIIKFIREEIQENNIQKTVENLEKNPKTKG